MTKDVEKFCMDPIQENFSQPIKNNLDFFLNALTKKNKFYW